MIVACATIIYMDGALSLVEVSRMDRVTNEDVRKRAGIESKLAS